MSKRHSDDHYKPVEPYHFDLTLPHVRQCLHLLGSAKSSRNDHHDEAKRSKVPERHTSDEDDYNDYKNYNSVQEPLKITTSKTKNDFAKKKTSGIQIKLGVAKKVNESKPKISVASVFNQDSDDEPEEMPREARMKMRNIGRDTPTSAGPNSFGKTKQGFCHAKRVFEKSVEQALEGLKD